MRASLTLITTTTWLALAACGEPGETGNEGELITAVILSFSPVGGGTAVIAEFDDPDGDGGQAPTIDPVNLDAGTPYMMTVRFQNRLEATPEEITDEVRDEGDQHQVFFTGTAVVGPATTNTTGPLTHAYADTDINGLPLGLVSSVGASTGTGTLVVTLRHMPPEEPPAKAANTAELVRTGGFEAIGGSSDASVSFTVTVQ